MLFDKNHNQKGHLCERRVYNELIEDKYYWTSIRNDILNYVSLHPTCIREKNNGIKIKSNTGKIIPNGPKG